MVFESKTDLVARRLRQMITDGTMLPGAILRQRDLAIQFGVSATPIREALQRLEAEGYVESQLHRGASVVRPDAVRDEENSRIRAVLEALATEWAAERATQEDLDEIAAIHERFKAAVPHGDLLELNRQFHLRIYSASGSQVLLSLIGHLWVAFRGGPNVEKAAEHSIPEHEEILDALNARDPQRAASAMERHIHHAMRYIPFRSENLGYAQESPAPEAPGRQ